MIGFYSHPIIYICKHTYMNKDHELTSSPTYHQAVKTLLVLSTGAYAWEKPTLVISNLYVTTTVDHSRMRGSYMCHTSHEYVLSIQELPWLHYFVDNTFLDQRRFIISSIPAPQYWIHEFLVILHPCFMYKYHVNYTNYMNPHI